MSAASGERALVTGAGGFIGHHLVSRLKAEGCWVRGADLKRPEYEPTQADEFLLCDLRNPACAKQVMRGGFDYVYALAADMGGMGFISSNHAQIFRNNTLINLATIHAAAGAEAGRYLFASSACVYPQDLQTGAAPRPLREDDALAGVPTPDAYSWEKLFTERLCGYYSGDSLVDTRVARLHNIYGPLGTYAGGREKAPAALCRKVALVDPGGEIEVWGDGRQARSYCYIGDCVEGLLRVMRSPDRTPFNIGSDRLISVDALGRLILGIAGKERVRLRHVEGPQGVRGRNSDNAKVRELLNWEPRTSLEDGLAATYAWISSQVR